MPERIRWRDPFRVPGTSARIQRALRLFWVDGLLISTSTSLVSSYLILYALEFGATPSQIGLMSTLVAVGSMLALLPGARLAERWVDPRRVVLIFGRGAAQVVWAFLGLLPTFLAGQPAVYGVLALRAARSFTVNASSSAWAALSARIVPHPLRGKYFAARNIAKQAAALLVVPAAGWLIDLLGFPVGYQVSFGLAAVIGLFAFWAYSRIPFEPADRQPPARKENAGPRAWETASSARNYWAFCATSACWTFSLQFAAPFFTVYMVEQLGASAGIIGTLAAAHSLTALPGQALFGRWLDRHGIKWTYRLSGLLIPFLAWGWLLVAGPWGALPINLGAGFLFAGYDLSTFNMLLSITPRSRRTHYIAVYKTIVQSAAAVAPLLGGYLVGRIGFLPVFALSGCGRMVSVLLMMRFVKEPRSTGR